MELTKDRILIIEDNAGLNELLSEKVQNCGYETYSVYSAVHAFEWLEVNKAFLILLDFSLPDLNGKEFIEWLKSENIPVPPFIVATGQGDERIAVEMMKLGARDYVVKDSNFLELIPLVINKVFTEIQNELKLQLVENELAQSNQFNNQIIKSAQEGIVVYDLDLKCKVWNPFMEKITGVPASSVLGKKVLDIFPFLIETEMSENLKRALIGEQGTEIEFYFSIPETGKSGWVSEIYAPLLNAGNQVIGVIAAVHDITERKLAEKKIEKIGQHYKALIEKAPDGFVLLNTDGHFKYVSPSGRRIFGYDATDEIFLHPNDLTHPDDLPMVLSHLEKLMQDPLYNAIIEYRFANKSGNWVWIESTFSNLLADPNVESIVINFRDITDRKLAEMGLLESESRYHTLFNSSFEAILLTSPDGTIIAANPSACEMFMMSEEELKLRGRNGIVDITDPRLPMALEVREKTGKFNGELDFVRANGEKFTADFSSSIFKDKDGNNRTSTVIRDVTERKKSEQALRESEELYRNLVERLPDGVYKSTPEGKFVDINPALVKMLGYDNKEEMMAIDIKTDLYFDVADRENSIQNEFNQELDAYLLKKKDGSGVWVEDNGWYTKDENGNIIAHEGVLRDITERKNAEFAMQENRNMLHKLLFTSSELIDSSSNTIDYERITEIARELSGAKYACFNLFDENGRDFTSVAFSGLSNFQQKALDLFGFEIIDRKWDYDPVKEASIKDNTITEFDSLETLVSGLFSKFIFNRIKKTYKLGKVAVVKITKNNINVGDFTLLMNEGAGIKNHEILELFANQVGLFIERQIAEEKLRKNEEKFRVLFAENPQPMFVYDVESLEILEVNQTALNFYGYTKEECLSMSVKVLHSLEELPIFLKTIEQTKAGINTDGISHHIKKNGEKIMVEVFTVPATSIGKNARHVLVVDITERKLAEEALNHKMEELIRFHRLTVGREHSMIELKREINNLLVKFGEMEKYKIVE